MADENAATPEEATQAWLERIEEDAWTLCTTVKEATDAGVPEGLMLPCLVAVFREAGMLPDFDYGSLLGMLNRG